MAVIPSVAAMKGRVGFEAVADPAAFERANYIRTLQSWAAGKETTAI